MGRADAIRAQRAIGGGQLAGGIGCVDELLGAPLVTPAGLARVADAAHAEIVSADLLTRAASGRSENAVEDWPKDFERTPSDVGRRYPRGCRLA
jgi:hypothetical protein